ncbi:MAG TPA: hypothetical protein DIW64_11185 [Cellvibrio sp.]|nr:hypothetical protein [Cellvibrio sp.]
MSNYFPAANYPGIFSTPEWVDAWKNAWADHSAITAAGAHESALVGHQQFYSYQQKKSSILSFTTLFPAGISTSASPSLRSEYFMLVNQKPDDFIAAALCHKWSQLFIPDMISTTPEYAAIVKAAESNGLQVLVRDAATSYAVRLQENSFDNYLKHIGSNTRLKLFNKRKKLYAIGEISQQNLWPDVDSFIEILNEFRVQRWNKPCYQGRNLKQITAFLQNIAQAGGRPDLSVIYCDGKPVSAVLDLYYRQRIYNIQSGYIEKFRDGISLGTLHLGLQIEKAFATDAIYYDFMAGNGKKSNYKKSLATHSAQFASLMLVRSPLLKKLYYIKDRLLGMTTSKGSLL